MAVVRAARLASWGPVRRFSIAEVAEYLGVDIRHVRRLVHERRIPFYKWGHLLRFDLTEIAAWLTECRYEPRRRA